MVLWLVGREHKAWDMPSLSLQRSNSMEMRRALIGHMMQLCRDNLYCCMHMYSRSIDLLGVSPKLLVADMANTESRLPCPRAQAMSDLSPYYLLFKTSGFQQHGREREAWITMGRWVASGKGSHAAQHGHSAPCTQCEAIKIGPSNVSLSRACRPRRPTNLPWDP